MANKMIDLLRAEPELWDRFTRKEEYSQHFRDKFDRFPYFLSSCRSVFNPSVSDFLMKNGYAPEYPGEEKFAVCLTHDIDVLFKPFVVKGRSVIRSMYKGDRKGILDNLRKITDKKVPYCNFDSIMDLEEKYGAKSSFYFLTSPEDPDYYAIDEFEDELNNIHDRGCEIGLHGGHQAYASYERICKEKRRLEEVLGKPVAGYRNHFLRFLIPDTWEYLATAGFAYDSTLGYADCVGFRNGMCHPFRPYHLGIGSEIDIIEIPLIVMDNTLFHNFMRLDHRTAMDVINQLIDKVASCRGVFTLLWHNSSLLEGTPERSMYEEILHYCFEKGAWMTSGEEIARWWRKNEHF
jgi:peptidoglycan/xylan/chitin deacetylase (PgdA/CDA1 family)